MLPIDPRDGQGSVTHAQPFSTILPAQAMAHGGTTIIRPGAVAWGGLRDTRGEGNSSCEAIERALGSVARDPSQLPGLIAELARTRLWLPLPVRQRPVTDGTAVRLPLVSGDGIDFVPCFTSVGRLGAWAEAVPARGPGSLRADGTAADGARADGAGRPWRRAGDARIVPHIVVAATGLARRLPPGLGLAINPDAAPSVPLYPECVSYLGRLAAGERIPAQRMTDVTDAADTAPAYLVGSPPAEPAVLLRAAGDGLGALARVGQASRAWLSVPGRGEGLVISVTLDDPGSDLDRGAVVDALRHACAAVPLHVPFAVDVTFPGESVPDAIDEWIVRNTRPFYTRS